MARRAQGVLEAAQKLLSSTLGKELRKGDTIGVWTYNETLNSGRFPLQQWWPAASNNAISAITGFLAREKYEKQPRFDRVRPALASVVASSPVLTVILISSGTEDIHGTPFDAQINATYKEWREQQQRNRLPFVALFRATQGKMTGCAVAAAPWPLEVPPLPQLPKVAVAQTNAALTASRVQVVPPLIVSGKKSQRAPTNSVPEATTTSVEAPRPATQTVLPLTDPVRANAQIATSATGAGNAKPGSGDTPGPVLTNATVPKPEPAANFEASVVASLASTNGVSPGKAVPTEGSTAKDLVTNIAAPASTVATHVNQAVLTNQTSLTEPLTTPPGPSQVATTAPQTHSLLNLTLLLGAGVFVVIAAGWFWLFRSRSRGNHPISLITRSLDRKE